LSRLAGESELMAEIGGPPFGFVFDPEERAKQYHQGIPDVKLARIGLPDSK
jgi:hypothetical protein